MKIQRTTDNSVTPPSHAWRTAIVAALAVGGMVLVMMAAAHRIAAPQTAAATATAARAVDLPSPRTSEAPRECQASLGLVEECTFQ